MVHVSDCCVGNGPEDSCFLVKIVSDVLVRPPRDEYDINDLGPQYFKLHGKQYKRTDFFVESQGHSLCCSNFGPVSHTNECCVVYLHGN